MCDPSRTGGALVFRVAGTDDLARMSLDGGAPTMVARGVDAHAHVAGDTGGICWVAPDCSIWQAPGRRLGSGSGSPAFLFVDARDVYVFSTTTAPPSPPEVTPRDTMEDIHGTKKEKDIRPRVQG